MIIEVWEVYKKDSQECIVFKTEEQARNQKVFDEVDIVTAARVSLSNEDIYRLNNGHAVWV